MISTCQFFTTIFSAEIKHLHKAFEWWPKVTCMTFTYVPPKDIMAQKDLVLYAREMKGEDNMTMENM
jgi:hypothetical protein